MLTLKIYRVQLVTWLWNVGIVKDHADGKESIKEYKNGGAVIVENTSGKLTGKIATVKK